MRLDEHAGELLGHEGLGQDSKPALDHVGEDVRGPVVGAPGFLGVDDGGELLDIGCGARDTEDPFSFAKFIVAY
jgi:hypothetical protein